MPKNKPQIVNVPKANYIAVRGMNLKEGATAMDRNRQIGGHKA